MLGFMVLVDEVFNRERLMISYQNAEKKYPKEATKLIERIWLEKKASGIRLFDGKLFEVISYKTRDQILSLELQNTSYKYLVGTREAEFVSKFGSEMISNSLSVGAVVVSSDDCFVLGKRRSDLYFNPGKYSTIAGTMDPEKDFKGGNPDPFEAILRELFEEKGVEESNVRDALCLGLIYNIEYKQTYMPFYIKLGISCGALQNSSPREEEFERFIYVKADGNGVSDFLAKNLEQVSQTCQGNILMFGKRMFGIPWFKDILSRLKVEPEFISS
ncbi:MAG: NUDIX hydrolase [Candidatus Atabeyarchaeum deiterrae]